MRQFIIMLICSLFLLGCTNPNGDRYEVRNDGVYYVYTISEESSKKIEDADKDSFKDLGCFYGKDKNHVYYFASSLKKIEGADPKTFELINCDGYSKDANTIYYRNKSLVNADPNSFTIISIPSGYSKDANTVYHGNESLVDADPNSFTVISTSYGYGKDNENVYQGAELLPMVDAPTVEILENRYIKDKNYVYFYNATVTGATPDEFQTIEVDHMSSPKIDGKDDNNIYYRGEKITLSDI